MERPEIIVIPSAHKHGVSEDDMLHAFDWFVAVFEGNRGMTIRVGRSTDLATWIEVGYVVGDHHIVICHAMVARPRYRP